jgi:hypothetical protein
MSRPLRVELPGAPYHVMNRGLAARPILTTDADHGIFLEGLGEIHTRRGLRILAYCLMRTHYHLRAESYSTVSSVCAMPSKGDSRRTRTFDGSSGGSAEGSAGSMDNKRPDPFQLSLTALGKQRILRPTSQE